MRFYRMFRSFLIFNAVVVALFVFGRTSGGLFLASVIWGAILFSRYVKLFGWPGTNGWFGEDWQAWMEERERKNYNDDDGPAIRDKDLV